MRRLLFILVAVNGFSEPKNPQPICGEVSFANQENQFIVTSHGDSIIHWESFSIGATEQVYFSQDGFSSAILNRVVGGEPSELLGSLLSNGRVFLVNQMGIYIGKEAVIDTSAFLASTLDVLDRDFLDGADLHLSGLSAGTIRNYGLVKAACGDIVLCARNVVSEGRIEAKSGSVLLGAGIEFLYRTSGEERLFVRAQAPSREDGALDVNGSIEALQIELKGSNPFARAIQLSGAIDALNVESIGGKVILVSDGDTIVSGLVRAEGGDVLVTGDRVGIESGAKIDVSANGDGGNVYIGKDPLEVHPSARATGVDLGAEICVRSFEQGNGGNALIWGDESAIFAGAIDGRGGDQGGDGGWAEVSADSVAIPGRVSLGAAKGKSGTFLIDPTNIQISSSTTSGTWSSCVPPISYQIMEGTSPNFIDPSELVLLLDGMGGMDGCSVTIDTTSMDSDAGNIQIFNDISWTSDKTLTLIADNQILIQANISNSDSVDTGFTAMDFRAYGRTGADGIIYFSNGFQVTTANGDISFLALNDGGANSHGITVDTSQITTTGSGNIRLEGHAGNQGNPEGVLLFNSNGGGLPLTQIQSTSSSPDAGTITILGYGGTGGGAARGFTIFNYSTIATNAGDISITGQGGVSSGNSYGCILDTNSNITSSGIGSISITATGGSSDGDNGIFLVGGSSIQSTSASGGGDIILNGTGGTGTNNDVGVLLLTPSSITSSSGSIQITGTGGGAISGSGNDGFQLNSSCQVYTGTGSLSIDGILGSGGVGINLQDSIGNGSMSGDIVLSCDTIVVNASIQTTGNFTSKPHQDITTIGIADGSTGTLFWPSGSLANLSSPYTSVTFGSPSQIGEIDIASYAFPYPIIFNASGTNGSIVIDGGIFVFGAPISFYAQGTGGSISLNNLVLTQAFNISFYGPVLLPTNNTITIDTTYSTGFPAGANILFDSTVDAAVAGTGTLQPIGGTAGIVTFNGAVGSAIPPFSVTPSGVEIDLNNNITTDGGPIPIVGAAVIGGDCILDTTYGGMFGMGANISFSSTVDGTLTPHSLTVTAGSVGTAVFSADVGSTHSLSSFSASGASVATYGNITTHGGAISIDGPFVFNSPMMSTTITLNTTDGGTGGDIIFSGTVDAGTAGGDSLTLIGGSGDGTIRFLTDVGSLNRPQTLTLSSGLTTEVGANITADTIAMGTSITLIGASSSSTFDTSSANTDLTFNNPVFGSTPNGNSLTLNPGTGSVLLYSDFGTSMTPLGNVQIGMSVTNVVIETTAQSLFANSVAIPNAVAMILDNTSLYTIDTSNGGGNISLGLINGAGELALAAGSGTVNLGSPVGNVNPIGSLTVSGDMINVGFSVYTVGADNFSATSTINLGGDFISSSGAMSFSGHTILNNSLTMDSTNGGMSSGATISFAGDVDSLSFTQSLIVVAGSGNGVFTSDVGVNLVLPALTVTSANQIQLGANVNVGTFTIGSTIPVVLINPMMGSSTTITTANTDLTFPSTINEVSPGGTHALTLSPGTAAITFSANVGNTFPIGGLTLSAPSSGWTIDTAVTLIAASSVTVESIPTTLNNSSLATIDTSPFNGNISFSSTIDGAHDLALTAGSGDVSFGAIGGSSALTSLTASGGTINQNSTAKTTGAIQYTGTTQINLFGNQTTSGGLVAMTGPTQLHSSIAVDTTNGGGTAAGASISYLSTLDATTAGMEALTLNAGTTGSVTFGGAIGGTTRLGGLTIANAKTTSGAVQIGANITSNSFVITTASPVTLNGSSVINTSAANGDLLFGSTIDGASAGSQAFTLTPGSGSVAFSNNVGGSTRLGALTISSGSSGLSVGASVTTIAANSLTLSGTVPVTLNNTGTLTINTSASNGNISFGGTVDGVVDGSQPLTFSVGNGTVAFSADVGATKRLGAFAINPSGGSFVLGTNFTQLIANSISVGTGIATLLQNTSLCTLNTSATGGAISLGGTINGSSSGAQSLTLNAGSGAIALGGSIGAVTPLGGVVIASGSSGLSVGDSITEIASASWTVSGTVPTTLANSAPLTIDTTNGAGAITFGGTIDGIVAGAQSLTLSSGGGLIGLLGDIGASIRLGAFSITALSGQVSVGAAVANLHVNSCTVGSGVPILLNNTSLLTVDTRTNNGNISFGGTVDGASSGAQDLTLNAGTGSIILSDDLGSSTPLGDVIIASGASSLQIGANASEINAASWTVAGTVPTTLSNTGLLTIAADGSIAFGGSIDGSHNLTLAAGTGTVTLSGNIGSDTRVGAVTIASGAGGLSLGSGLSSIKANGWTVASGMATTMNSNLSIDTNVANGSIVFGGTLNGAFSLNLAAGSGIGAVTFSANVGGVNQLGAISIASAGSGVVFGSAVTTVKADSFSISTSIPTQLQNSGTLTLTTSGGIGDITFGGPINGAHSLVLATGGGSISFASVGATTPLHGFSATGGTVNQNSTVQINTSGSLVYNGSIGINLNGSVSTSGQIISMTGPIALTAPIAIDTTISTPAGANITFNNSIDGNKVFTVSAGTAGIVEFAGSVGQSTPLSTLTVNAASTNLSDAYYAQGGTITFNSPVVLTTDTVFSDTGSTGIIFNSTVSGSTFTLSLTAPNGAVTAQNTIDVKSLNVVCSLDASFGGAITTHNGVIDITSTNGSISVQATTSNGGNITFQPTSIFTSNVLSPGDNIPNGTLILNGNISAGTGIIKLSNAGYPNFPMSVAPITGNPSGGNLTITGGSILIGYNECLSVLGSLTMTATDIQVCDTIALDSIQLNASSTLTIYLHGSGSIYDYTGHLVSTDQTNILSNTMPTHSGVIMTVGPGSTETIAAASFTEPQLKYAGYLLDFTTSPTPPPPPPPPPGPPPTPLTPAIATKIKLEAELAITEMLTMRLPIFWNPTCTQRDYACEVDCCQPDLCCPMGTIKTY